ncbi:hypothetical protein EJC51_02235 [Streptomyces aquilus]|uniref:VOC family protein n=1 Tax=Streptomyces aquilus TaxID=2548456 RepID=A0A3Q9BVZ0_9ACTN|nr:hypothetical protein [Streptomyces aquilus]AZP15054.1 hypothetical protein EJC51_02235 [Streptomyces aquilus]
MKTLFVSYRVSDLARSPAFYTALGYAELGRVELGGGARLVLLTFPGEPAASLKLVHRPDAAPADPDGYRIELVEWPPGHPDGITAADFA